MRGLTFATLSLVVAVSGCATPAARNSPDLAAMDEAWEAALNAGDIAKLVALYTDDARVLPPNAEMSQGKAAVEATFNEMIAAGLQGSLTSVEAMEAGDIGYSVGTYELKDANGVAVDSGKYVEAFRNVGGEWKISNDIWNSDIPATGGAKMIIAHKVKDAAHWLAAWEGEHGRREVFAQNGAPSVTIFSSPDNRNHHALLVDVADMDAFTAWASSPEAAAAKAEDGVLDKGFMIFTPIE